MFLNEISDNNEDINNKNLGSLPPVNCSDYDLSSFRYGKLNGSPSFLHQNISTLGDNKNELESTFSTLDHKFDVIAITESKIKKGIAPIFNTSLKGYNYYHTPTESECGGI